MLEEQLKTLGIAPPNDEEARIIAYWRTKTPAERIRAASQAAEVVREMIAAELRERNPQWSELRVRHMLASIWLSDALKDEVLYAHDILAGKPEIRERVMAAVFGERSLRVCPDLY